MMIILFINKIQIIYIIVICHKLMVEFTDMKGQELVDIKETEDKLELSFKNNKYIIQIVDGNFKITQTI